jgi:hypothetical protein
MRIYWMTFLPGSNFRAAQTMKSVESGPERRCVRGLILTRLGGNRTLGGSRKKHQRLTVQPAKLHRGAQTFAAPCIEFVIRRAILTPCIGVQN